MSFRFRKRIKLGGVLNLNLSKSGFIISGGVNGARIGIGLKGAYTSAGIPGTGLYSMSYLNSNRPKDLHSENTNNLDQNMKHD